MKPQISIRQLVKTYPNGVRALRGIDLDIAPGEFLVIIGLSGSGKSTLLRCLNRLHEPTSGSILFEGQDITHANRRAVRAIRRDIAMIFQQFNLIGRQSVFDNALMGALGRTSTVKSVLGLFAKKDRQMVQSYLDLMGIGDKSHYRADQLSGGQQQRVAIARALTQGPKVLLADEPVASLDPATCHTVMDYLRKINREMGITVICNLHFLSLVREYASRVIALRSGEMVYDGHPSDITEGWFKKIYGEDAREVFIQ